MARRIPLPRLTRRQRLARWQRERRQQALYVVVFSGILFFVVGLVAWAASDKYYTDNLKPALRFDGRVVPTRDYKSELKYALTRFYVEFGVPAGYENDPQIAQQKASYERSSLDAIEERAILDSAATTEGITVTPDAVDARYQDDVVKRWLASGFTVDDIKTHTRYDIVRDEITKPRQDQAVVSPTAQVHLAMIQVATPKPAGGDFQALTDQLQKIANINKELDAGTDFAEVAKKYSEDTDSKDKRGDLGWIARGMLTDLGAENEAFSLDAGARSQQHNGLVNTTWYKVIEK